MKLRTWYPILDKLSTQKVFWGTFVLAGVIPSIIAIIEGTAFVSAEYPKYPFFGPYIIWPVNFLILFPILTTNCYLFYKKSINAVNASIANGIISLDEKGFNHLQQLFGKAQSRRKFLVIITIAILLAAGFLAGPSGMFKLHNWASGNIFGVSVMFIVAMTIWICEVFIVILMFTDCYLWIKIQRAITKKDGVIKFSPSLLHPDKTAGLSDYGYTALKIYYFVFVLFFFVIVQIVEKFIVHPELDLFGVFATYKAVPMNLGLLLFILPVSFLTPLAPFYTRLKAERNKYMEQFRNLIHEKLPTIQENVFSGSYKGQDSVSADMTELEMLNKMYSAIKNIPLWPFDIITLRNIIITIAIPIIMFILDHVVLR